MRWGIMKLVPRRRREMDPVIRRRRERILSAFSGSEEILASSLAGTYLQRSKIRSGRDESRDEQMSTLHCERTRTSERVYGSSN